jgi:tellurite resistance protein
MFEQTGQDFYRYVGMGLLTLLTGIVALLLVRTAIAVQKNGICVPGN